MNAKEYLRQLQTLDIKIKQKIEERDELKLSTQGVRAVTMDPNKVQTSIGGDQMSDAVARYLDLDERINKMIDEFIDQKDRIINQIQMLTDPKHIQILYLRYVKFLSFEKISVEMGYGYEWICRLHGRALQDFEKKVIESHMQ